MRTLVIFCFIEFGLLALLVPGLTPLCRTSRGKLLLSLVMPAAGLAVAMIMGGLGRFDPVSRIGVLQTQALVGGFALALAGSAAMLSRWWPWGGPLLVTVLGLLILATPFWGDLPIGLPAKERQRIVVRALVTPNPLFVISRQLSFDWTHGNVLYGRLTRIGEDFPQPPTADWRWLSLSYAGAGLLAALLSGLVRTRERRAEYFHGKNDFC